MADHCFISYSTADALDFARTLANELEGGYPYINVWFDKRDLRSEENWDSQVAEAIQTCKCMFFVMSRDSTTENSVCAEEWDWAMRYKKPIVPLRLHTDIEVPFRLGRRQWIDFSGNFEAGIAKLYKYLDWLDSPEGILQSLRYRLADAERDLRRARPEHEARIRAEIQEINQQIKRQEEIVQNPKAAEEQTQENIETGLEHERQPETLLLAKTNTKFINPPPGIAPTYFQDRIIETQQIVNFLNNDAQRLMMIVGRAGVGKTAMICRLLKSLESATPSDNAGKMKVDGIVYLSETGTHRVNFANIFQDLSRLLPSEAWLKLESVYKDPQISPGDKTRALLDSFSQDRVILLLDNFENLIDSETQNIRDAELSDTLNALLSAPQHTVKVVLTTRVAPRDLAMYEPGRQYHLSLDEGLESPYAEQVLREMDSDGHVGLKNASDELLSKAREKTRGYPRALEALYAILSVDRYTTLKELLDLDLPKEIVEKFVGEAFNRLDLTARKVMQALAIYNRPISPAAVDYLLQPYLPSINSGIVLNRLVNMHFVRRESGKYYLHPADREYALHTIPESKSETNFTQRGLTLRAADYFVHARKPQMQWKKLDDLAAQLAEFDLRYAAGDYDTAARVLGEIDDLLQQWGHYHLTIKLNESILEKLTDKFLIMSSLSELGWAYLTLGETKKAINLFQQGLKVAREEPKNRRSEGVFLGSLGNTYLVQGEAHLAIENYQKALIIAREIGDRRGEGSRLGNLSSIYSLLGDVHKAIELLEDALKIAHEIGDRDGELNRLGNLGNRYADLGEARKEIEIYEQALVIAGEIGDRRGEGINLGNIAAQRINLGEYELAIQSAEQYVKICKEINKPASYAFRRLVEAFLHKSDLAKAREYVEMAQKYDEPQNNHNISLLLGITALQQGDLNILRYIFKHAIAQADTILAKTPQYYEVLDTKGLALCGLAICDDKKYVGNAIEAFHSARKLAPHAGVVKSVLRLFDELVKCDDEGILRDLRKAVEGKDL